VVEVFGPAAVMMVWHSGTGSNLGSTGPACGDGGLATLQMVLVEVLSPAPVPELCLATMMKVGSDEGRHPGNELADNGWLRRTNDENYHQYKNN